MLNKDCIKILKELNKFYGSSNSYIEKDALAQMCNLDSYQIETCLNYLISQNLIEKDDGIFGKFSAYHSTVDGKNYFSNKSLEFLKIVFTSIICPVVVSIVTTLLTMQLVG